jgi:hypothetical protein
MLQFRVKELLEACGDRPPHRPLGERLGIANTAPPDSPVRRIC